MNTEAATKAPTAAQLKLNHERATKAAAKMTEKGHGAARVTAICEPGELAVLVLERRPYNSRKVEDFEEIVRITTDLEQTIGNPVSYDNKYSSGNMGTMCYRLDRAEESRRNKLAGLRSFENKVSKLREELAEAEADVAARRADLGL